MEIARVINKLNIRKKPSVNAPCYGYLNPGEQIKFTDIVCGDFYERNNLWLKLDTGEYIWSGCVNLNDNLSVKTDEGPWWLRDFGILDIPDAIRGKGVRIALLDTGMPQPYYKDTKDIKIIDQYNFVPDVSETVDGVGHATNCAGIIAGRGPKIWGIAPEVSFLIAKVTDSLYSLNEGNLINAIDWAIRKEAQIISMSLCIAGGELSDHDELYKKIKEASSKNIIIVSAIGNDGTEFVNYPACFDECISVGAINRNRQITKETTRNIKMSLLAPGADIPAIVPINGDPVLSGTSFAAAYTSAEMAVMISISPKPPDQLVDILLKSPIEFVDFNPPYKKKYGIINPHDAITQAKGVS